MPKRSTSVKRIKPPVGFQEAVRLLTNVFGMSDSMRNRRLKQAAYNIGCAIPWAEKASAAADFVDSGWLAQAVRELRRAERLLEELALDAETGRRGWQVQFDATLKTFEDINLLYARGAFMGFAPQAGSPRR